MPLTISSSWGQGCTHSWYTKWEVRTVSVKVYLCLLKSISSTTKRNITNKGRNYADCCTWIVTVCTIFPNMYIQRTELSFHTTNCLFECLFHRYIKSIVHIVRTQVLLQLAMIFYLCKYYYIVTTIESSCFVNANCFIFLLRQRYWNHCY